MTARGVPRHCMTSVLLARTEAAGGKTNRRRVLQKSEQGRDVIPGLRAERALRTLVQGASWRVPVLLCPRVAPYRFAWTPLQPLPNPLVAL